MDYALRHLSRMSLPGPIRHWHIHLRNESDLGGVSILAGPILRPLFCCNTGVRKMNDGQSKEESAEPIQAL